MISGRQVGLFWTGLRQWITFAIMAMVLVTGFSCRKEPPLSSDDQYLWLEEIEGARALEWVKARNQETLGKLQADPRFKEFQKTALDLLQDQERIPFVIFRGDALYNFWQDEKNVRGIIRKTSWGSYLTPNPQWETVLDFDLLAKTENENWVYQKTICLEPEERLCMIALSRGGKDAVVYREFDLKEKKFVKGGFEIPEAKTQVTWLDDQTLLVGTDFGEGTLTESGYPRQLKIWKRGTPLSRAELLFEGEAQDVSTWAFRSVGPEGSVLMLGRSLNFFQNAYWWLPPGKKKPEPLDLPADSEVQGVFRGNALVSLRKEWKGIPNGSLVSVPLGKRGAVPEKIYVPEARSSLMGIALSKDALYLSILENVTSRLFQVPWQGDHWGEHGEVGLPGKGSVSLFSTSRFQEKVLLTYEGFTEPENFYWWDGKQKLHLAKSLKEAFPGKKYETLQYEATSKDGEKIPYFVVQKKGTSLNSTNPTLLYGYGGFEISQTPSYSKTMGKLWLEKGGVYVVANIRGGGEFGPQWHQAALKENRQRAFDDFIAVGEDLVKRKVTSPRHLGIFGGSNGGLLVGATFVQRPNLFHAVYCAVPLLDMFRYHHLLAGASWVAEYGNPDDPQMAKVIGKYSPYQNVKAGQPYPEVFFTTSTKDDRVHPGHARKMVAKMREQGHAVLYYENTEGGHGGAANLKQHALRYALEYVYFHQKLADPEKTE